MWEQDETLVPGPEYYDESGWAITTGLVPGELYRWQPGENDWDLDTGTDYITGPALFRTDFTAVRAPGTPFDLYTGRIYRVYTPLLPPEAAGLTDESGNTLTDEDGNTLTPDP
jgi:hypothetical protein